MSEQPCACKIQRRGDEIDFMEIAFCPLHQAAGELLEACRLAFVLPRPWMDGGVSWPDWDAAFSAIESAIARAEER